MPSYALQITTIQSFVDQILLFLHDDPPPSREVPQAQGDSLRGCFALRGRTNSDKKSTDDLSVLYPIFLVQMDVILSAEPCVAQYVSRSVRL